MRRLLRCYFLFFSPRSFVIAFLLAHPARGLRLLRSSKEGQRPPVVELDSLELGQEWTR